jgi:hypothetical protein
MAARTIHRITFTPAAIALNVGTALIFKKYMGDKSPKSVQKQSKQKQVKSNSADQKKRAAATAKQTPRK